MMSHPRLPRRADRSICLLLGLSLVGHVGCVALNIPSARLHDPSDGGGVLGHWKRGSAGHQTAGAFDPGLAGPPLVSGDVRMPMEGPSMAACIDGGPLGFDPMDPALDANGQTKPPEIPWPRFHPVPTRPVFGSPTGVMAGP